MHKFPYEKYLIVGGIIMLAGVVLATALCSCSFLVKELPVEEKIAEDIVSDVIRDVEGSAK